MAGWGHFDRHFAIWAERNGYEMDYASMHDVYDNPDFLEPYDLIVQVGHDEYHTFEYRKVVDAHFARGGKPSAYPKSSPVRQELTERGRSNLSGSCRLRAPSRLAAVQRALGFLDRRNGRYRRSVQFGSRLQRMTGIRQFC